MKNKSNLKKEEGYNYIYLVTHVTHVVSPHEYNINYVVYSNQEMTEEEIKLYFEKNNIKCGEFGVFFANHIVETLEEVNFNSIPRYTDDNKNIYID